MCRYAGRWREALNSDAAHYGGSGEGNLGGADAAPVPAHGRFHSLTLPLAAARHVFFTCEARSGAR